MLLRSALVLLLLSARADDAAPGELVPPALRNQVELVYPPQLAEGDAPPAGDVQLRVVVDEQGVPSEVTVVQSVHPEIDAAVVAAVETLRFEPATLDGMPVRVAIPLTIPIAPPEPEPEPEPEPQPPQVDDAMPTGDLEGRILAAGERTPIAGASIVIVPADTAAGETPAWTVEAATDTAGRFRAGSVPAGAVHVRVLAPGFEPYDGEETIRAGVALEVRYSALPTGFTPYRTVVESGNVREEVGRRRLSVAEIQAIPGNQGDALRALQTLPGVARAPFGVGLIVVRGSSPFDTSIYVGEHLIPILFHFGALSTAVSSDTLAGVEFIPSNFDARYGNSNAGVIQVEPRKGRRDGFHGHAEVDLLDAGVQLEGPLGRGSFIAAGRRSIVDAALGVALPDDAELTLARAPRYYDYQVFVDQPVGKGDLALRFFGGDDRFVFVQQGANEEEADAQDRNSTTALFHRADLEYRHRVGPWRFVLSPSYRYERGDLGGAALLDFDIARHAVSGRAEMGVRVARTLDVVAGTETVTGFFRIDGEAPAGSSLGLDPFDPGGAPVRVSVMDRKSLTALYSTATIGVGTPFRLVPGVRFTYFARPMDQMVTNPRLRFAADVAENSTLRGGVGLYAQEPDIPSQTNVWGNRDLAPQRSLHASAEFEQVLPRDITATVVGFYKDLWSQVAASEGTVREDGVVTAENSANTGRGWVWGGELMLRRGLGGPFVGWLSYTLSWSRQRGRPRDPIRPSAFDQRHILNAVGAVFLPKRWRVGARFQLTSGLPLTPIAGVRFDAATGAYVPIAGSENSQRLPVFHQLTIRVDKRWVWTWGSLSAYLDLQNVYNARPVESYAYAYDYSARSPVGGLPIVPWVGLRTDF